MAGQQDYADNTIVEKHPQEQLSGSTYFYPEIYPATHPLTTKQLEQLSRSGLDTLLPKIRQKYQLALMAFLRNQKRSQQVELMQRIFAKLQNLCWDTPISPLWEASLALTECLRAQQAGRKLEATNLLQALDLQLKTFIKEGTDFVNSQPDDALFRELLFFIARSDCDEHFCHTLKGRYKLAEALNLSQREVLTVDNPPAVLSTLCAELGEIKETIDFYLLTLEPDLLSLQNQLPIFKQAAHSLQVLGMDVERASVQSSASTLAGLIEMPPQEKMLETRLLDIGRNLEKVLATLRGEDEQQTLSPAIPPACIQKASLALEHTRTALVDYVDNQLQLEHLTNACDFLRNAHRELSVSSLDQASELLRKCADFLHDHWKIEQGYHPDKTELQNLSDFVTSMEYFLDRHTDLDPEEPEAILDVAAQGLKALVTRPETFVPASLPSQDSDEELPAYTADELTLIEFEPVIPEFADVVVEKPEAETQNICSDLSAFLEDASEALKTLQQQVPEWVNSPESSHTLSNIRRAFHTVKGSGRITGANIIGELAWSLENMLNRVLDNSVNPNEEMHYLLARTVDMLPSLLDDVIQNNQLLTPDVLVCMEMADALARGEQYSAPEHPDDMSEEDETDVAVQFGEVVNESPKATGVRVEELSEHELNDIFRSEALGYLSALYEFIEQAENSDIPLLINSDVKRTLHSLKGICRISEYSNLGELVTAWEEVTDHVYQYELLVDEPVLRMFQEGCLLVANALSQLEDEPEELLLDSDGFLEWLTDLRQQLTSPITEPATEPVCETIHNESSETADTISETGYELELQELFLEEARDHNEACHKALDLWLTDTEDVSPVEELRRVLHTLKGGARLIDLPELSALSHALEEVYQRIIAHNPSPDQIPLGLLRASHDQIDKILSSVHSRHPLPSTEHYIQKLRDWLTQELKPNRAPTGTTSLEPLTQLPDYLGGTGPGSTGGHTSNDAQSSLTPVNIKVEGQSSPTTRVSTPVSRHIERVAETVRIPSSELEQQISLATRTDSQRLDIEQQVHKVDLSLHGFSQSIQLLNQQLQQLKHLSNQLAPDKPEGREAYESLRELTHTLTESAYKLHHAHLHAQEENTNTLTRLAQLSALQSELQEKLLRARLVPFASVVPRLEKVARQAASELDKPATLEVINEHILIDRTLLDRIMAPLEHLIRNAISHGIESQALREEQGKPRNGRLSLKLHHEDGNIALELHDDGQGIDIEAIRQRALEKRLITPYEDISESELSQFILDPGFSTAETVSQISGRGIGLDVVNTEVHQLGGELFINSDRNAGASFTLKLPFLLTATRSLLVEAASGVYAIPLNTLQAVVTCPEQGLQELWQSQQGLDHNGNSYELLSLDSVLQQAIPGLPEKDSPLLLIRQGQRHIALVADKLLGSQELVVRSLGAQFASLKGVRGGSLLNDGRVVIMIDPVVLSRRFLTHRYYSEMQSQSLPQKIRKVLIADDSATVRKVTSHLLKEQGFEVESVGDGTEAIVQLAKSKPDLLLLDIEMPKMDGFEVANLVRHDDSLKDLPIILISSQLDREQTEKAEQLGITEYYGKPFRDTQLLDAIHRLTFDKKA